MIREERDPAFWERVAAHPEVSSWMMGLTPAELAQTAVRQGVLPLAATHGGFLLATIDGLGLVYELHAVFTPEGWGGEANRAAKHMLCFMFERGASLIVSYQVAENRHARLPISFGARPAADWAETPIGRVKLWMLTKTAWFASPAYGRMQCRQLS